MTRVIEIDVQRTACGTRTGKRAVPALIERLKSSGSLLLIAAMFVCGTVLAVVCHIPVQNVMESCQRQFEIVRKRRRNFVVFRRGGG